MAKPRKTRGRAKIREPELPAGSWCEPLQGEDSTAFLAFRLYRDLWPSARCVETVALELGAGRDDVTLEGCRVWAELFSWERRAVEYDAWQDSRTVARRDEVERARALLSDSEGWLGVCFLRAARVAGERMARDGRDVSAQDAVRLARAARELLEHGGDGKSRSQSWGELFDKIPPEKVETLLAILEEAGVDVEDA